MIPAIIRAEIKPKPLRRRVNFYPSSFISKGTVTSPTITRVVINAEIVMMVAPDLKSEPAKGKAISEGIKVTAPSRPAKIVAVKPASAPTSFEIVWGVNTPKVNPTIPRTANRLGADLSKAFPPILKAFFVFSLFLIKEIKRKILNNPYIIIIVTI